jgi:hypothetical protein
MCLDEQALEHLARQAAALRSCATDADHCFNSPSNSQLQEAFEHFADQLSNLRIAE